MMCRTVILVVACALASCSANPNEAKFSSALSCWKSAYGLTGMAIALNKPDQVSIAADEGQKYEAILITFGLAAGKTREEIAQIKAAEAVKLADEVRAAGDHHQLVAFASKHISALEVCDKTRF